MVLPLITTWPPPMSGGSPPGRGPYGDRVARAVDYLLANTQASGFIVEPTATTHGPMYSHGFATLFLAECYGMSKRAELRDKLRLAVKLIVNSQNKEGGWRYYPKKEDADISVTACQVMALRAAHNAAGSKYNGCGWVEGADPFPATTVAAQRPTAPTQGRATSLP